MLVLSEFAGAARELSDALIINPYDTEQFADAIRYAVEMDEPERRAADAADAAGRRREQRLPVGGQLPDGARGDPPSASHRATSDSGAFTRPAPATAREGA